MEQKKSFFKYLKLIIFSAVFISAVPHIKAQVKVKAPETTIHSPEATSLGLYGQYPVNKINGLVSIDVPIYKIQTSSFELPISLSYHSSGIKVDQESSCIGLGWALNSGGVITRIVNGCPDENNYGFNNYKLIDCNSIDEEPITYKRYGSKNNIDDAFMLSLTSSWRGSRDTKPDLFRISTNTINAEFYFDNSGNPICSDGDKLKIIANLIQSQITVFDKSGNQYRFGKSLEGDNATETTSESSQFKDITNSSEIIRSGVKYYKSSFFLTEIISADGKETIKYKYKTYPYMGGSNSQSHYRLDDASMNLSDDDGYLFDGITNTDQTSFMLALVPTEIIFPNGKVVFNSIANREDDDYGFRIDRADIFNKENSLIQSVGFDNNDYFNRFDAHLISGTSPSSSEKKSLKLNAVKYYDSNRSFINQYKFDYDPTRLPARNTTGQDIWGYSNGQTGNSYMIPAQVYIKTYTGLPEYFGENRTPDFNNMKAASLIKITYPTGGYTSLTYEPNYYIDEKGFEGKAPVNQTVSLQACDVTKCDNSCLSGMIGNKYANLTPNPTVVHTVTGDLGTESYTILKYHVHFSDYNLTQGQGMTFKITKNTTQEYSYTHSPSNKSAFKDFSGELVVRNGDRIKIEANTNGVSGSQMGICGSPNIEASFHYKHYVPVENKDIVLKQAGGLRIKTMQNYLENGNLAKQTDYSYGKTKFGADSIGIGMLITNPFKRNSYNYPLLYRHINDKELRPGIWYTSYSNVCLGMNSGCPVYYEKVTETIKDLKKQGDLKSEYYYSPIEGYHDPKPGTLYPYNTIIYPEWLNSKLIATKEYTKQNDGTYKPVHFIDYQYDKVFEHKIKTLEVGELGPEISSGFWNSASGAWFYSLNENRFYYYNFYILLGRKILKQQTETFFEQDKNPISTTKEYNYNSSYDIACEKTTDSKGKNLKNIYKYPTDYSSNENLESLKIKNIIGKPIDFRKYNDNKLISGSQTKLNNYGDPTEVYNFESTVNDIPFDASNPFTFTHKKSVLYNTRNKINHIISENGISNYYLWGYNDQYPIVLIESGNASINIQDLQNQIDGIAISNSNTKDIINNDLSTIKSKIQAVLTAGDKTTYYTFSPLVGITSKTDPRGVTTYYDYDTSNRLKETYIIENEVKKILQKTEYNYKQQ